MHRILALACLVFLTACMSHERADDAGPASDAYSPLDAGPPALVDAPVAVPDVLTIPPDAACVPGGDATIRFDPGLPMVGPVSFLGVDPEPSEDGVRVHLDSCGGSCPFDLVIGRVGDALAQLGGGDARASGTLDTDGSSYAVLQIVDARRCAGCGGTLDLVVGELVSGRVEGLEVSTGPTRCSTGCGELREVTIATDTAELALAQSEGRYSADRTLYGHVARAYHAPCVICDCAQPDMAASGVAAALTGIFVPAP